MDLYREEILEHFRNPRNFGEFEHPDVQVREANASCGDLLELQLQLNGSKITEARFKGVGCALSIASASLLTETLKEMSVAEASVFNEGEMLKLLGIRVSSMRMKCVTLPLRALKRALKKIPR